MRACLPVRHGNLPLASSSLDHGSHQQRHLTVRLLRYDRATLRKVSIPMMESAMHATWKLTEGAATWKLTRCTDGGSDYCY